MKRHWSYLKYVVRHKWFVFVASYRIGASLWSALVHDLSKFLPSEWFPYAYTFYASDGSKRYNETSEFNEAWLKHQHRSPHHWQYWVLRMDNPTERYLIQDHGDWEGGTHIRDTDIDIAAHVPEMDLRADRADVDSMMRSLVRQANQEAGLVVLEMPRKYVLEMVADWMGAGRAITGQWECKKWYVNNKDKMVLHSNTRKIVESFFHQFVNENERAKGNHEP